MTGAAPATLVQAGQADGDIHQDVTVDDIYLLFSTAPTDQPPAARRPRTLAHPRPHRPHRPHTNPKQSARKHPAHLVTGCSGRGGLGVMVCERA
ncbi:hypothetical protein M2271_001440 [Streptomyces sp. LBL]|nr:hypothetical protein [Streptomyces sp. LBL]